MRCGINIEQMQSDIPDLKESKSYKPQLHTVVNWYTLLSAIIVVPIIVSFVKGLAFDIDYHDGEDVFITLIQIIILGIVGIMFFVKSFHKVYTTQCPYCNKEIRLPQNMEAYDCPICKERIIVDNNTPLKK